MHPLRSNSLDNAHRQKSIYSKIAARYYSAPGVWFDPSDFSTLYQDSTGATPVTAVEQPVGLMLDKAMSLSLGPELVNNGTFNTDISGTTALNGATLTWDSTNGGRLSVKPVSGNTYGAATLATSPLIVGRTYQLKYDVTTTSNTSFQVSGVQVAALLGNGVGQTVQFTATSTAAQLTPVVNNTTGIAAIFDNISLKEVLASPAAVRGPELVTNGSCTGLSGWTGNVNLTSPGGATIRADTGAGGVEANATNATPVVAGHWYEITFNLVSANNTGAVSIGGTRVLIPGSTVNSGQKRLILQAASTLATGVQFATNTPTAGYYIEVDNVSCREIAGFHAIQSTATSRPIISARYNLLTKTEALADGTAWNIGATSPVASSALPGGFALMDTTATGNHYIQQPLSSYAANTDYTFTVELMAGIRPWVEVRWSTANGGVMYTFDLTAGTFKTNSAYGTGVSASAYNITALGGGIYRVSLTGRTTDVGAGLAASVFPHTGSSDNYAGDPANPSVHIRHPGVRLASDAALNIPIYQRVNTTADYDTAGFPPYLKFDGVDDYLATPNSIDLTGTGQATIFAGMTKLAGTFQALLEMGTAGGPTGAILCEAPYSAGSYHASVTGPTAEAYLVSPANFPAPVSNIFTASLDITGTSLAAAVSIRVNGVAQAAGAGSATSTVAPGGGKLASNTLNIGRRSAGGSFFNGRLYGLAIIGAAQSATAISQNESFIGGKMGIAP